jgi:hypothetical protein
VSQKDLDFLGKVGGSSKVSKRSIDESNDLLFAQLSPAVPRASPKISASSPPRSDSPLPLSMSPVPQNIAALLESKTKEKPQAAHEEQIRQIISKIPDLSFMLSPTLRYPVIKFDIQ